MAERRPFGSKRGDVSEIRELTEELRELLETPPIDWGPLQRGLKSVLAKFKKKGTAKEKHSTQDVSAKGTTHAPTKKALKWGHPSWKPKQPKTWVDPYTGKEHPWDPKKAKAKKAKPPWIDPETGKAYFIDRKGKKHPWDPTKVHKPKPRKLWTSAGCVVIPALDDHDHCYIIKPSNNYGPWSFPKGRVDKGESMKQAALREVWEETGLKVKILSGTHAYIGKGKGSFSITHFYLAVRTGGSPRRTDETEKVVLATWEQAEAIFKRSGNRRDVKIAQLAQKALAHFKKKKK